MSDRRPVFVWLAVLVLVVLGFLFRQRLYVWLLRLHGMHS